MNKGTEIMKADTLNMKERISYGFGGMGNAIVLAMVSTFLMFFYTDVVKLNAGIIGSIFLASKVLDGLSDLIMGYIVDRTNSRFGKARCWLLWLCFPYAISGVLLFTMSPAWGDIVKYVYVFVTYNLVNTVMYTGICVPYNAMNCLLTKSQYERGLLGTTNVMGNVLGQVLVNTFMLKLVFAFGDDQTAWILASAVFGAIGILAHMICFINTAEQRNQHQEQEKEPGFGVSVKSLLRNKYWLIITAIATLMFFSGGVSGSSAMYFAKEILHDELAVSGLNNSASIAQIAAYCFSFYYIKRLGKGGCFRIGYTVMTITTILRIMAGSNYVLLIVFGVLGGLGGGMAVACLAGTISDSIEYGEWKTGVRCVGVGNAANTFSQKIGVGVGTAIVGWLLECADYSSEMMQQTSQTILAINTCYLYIPLVCNILIVLLAMMYHLDKEYPQIMKDLAQRHKQN